MKQFLKKLWRDEEGLTAIEYAILAGFITVFIVTALTTTNIGASLTTIFTSIGNGLATAAGSAG